MPIRIYECAGCGSRVMAQEFPGRCNGCGGHLMNIGVRRE